MESKYPRVVVIQQRALAAIRIFIGLWFLYSVSGKLSATWVSGYQELMMGMAKDGPPGFYAGFLRDVVIPNATGFAYAVILGELAVGVSMVLGLFTAPFALVGVFMNLNFLLATLPHGAGAVGINLTFIVVQLALAFGYAGTTWGIDRQLIDKTPWWCQGLLHYEYREF